MIKLSIYFDECYVIVNFWFALSTNCEENVKIVFIMILIQKKRFAVLSAVRGEQHCAKTLKLLSSAICDVYFSSLESFKLFRA